MILIEMLKNNTLIRHYTDKPEEFNLLQVDTGLIYEDAVDVYPTEHRYKEVPKPKEEKQEEM